MKVVWRGRFGFRIEADAAGMIIAHYMTLMPSCLAYDWVTGRTQ